MNKRLIERSTKHDLPMWPAYEKDEIDAVVNVLKSGKTNTWTGSNVTSFEQEFSKYIGMRNGIAVANGTVALELALHALGIGQDDDVIVPCKSFIATASSVVVAGAKPVFADIDEHSQNITVESIKNVITKNTKAIIIVHLGGLPCEMDSICKFVKERDIFLIEDCAQAHGAQYKGKYVGSFGDAAAFSFCQDKIMTMGEGGILLLRDKVAWKRAWSYKDHGKDYDTVFNNKHSPGFRWVHTTFGTNWRMTEMQAAIGRVQLKKLPQWLSIRNYNASILTKSLKIIPGIRVYEPPDHIVHAYYRYYCIVEIDDFKSDWNKDRLIKALNDEGVPCQDGGCSEIYLEKAFIDADLNPDIRLPNAKKLSEESICFLVHPTLKKSHMRKISVAIQNVLSAVSNSI